VDFYQTLGLTHTADANAIRTAYRALAKRYHPDVSSLPDAHERFVAVTEAYEVLSDPAARARYDRTRASPSPKRSSPAAEAQYARATEARQQAARAKAADYSRMRYAQFDADVFDSVAGYVLPKMLGCLGIGVVAVVLVLLLLLLAEHYVWLWGPVAIVLALGVMPAIVYASMQFDSWHNARQRARRKGR
jgi:hypothetical protein